MNVSFPDSARVARPVELTVLCEYIGDEASGKVKAIGIHDIKAGETHVAVVLVSDILPQTFAYGS